MGKELDIAALHVAQTFPIRGPEVDAALVKTVAAFSMMEDWERDLCKIGIHTDSVFHPSDCPERKKHDDDAHA